jgi:hypothetical protein
LKERSEKIGTNVRGKEGIVMMYVRGISFVDSLRVITLGAEF